MLSVRKQRKAVARYQVLRSEVMRMSPAVASAMLQGIKGFTVVTGQYTDNQGGACPLLAANRSGAPLHVQTNFPTCWDYFCGLTSARKARQASRHEVHMLELLLEEKLMPVSERGGTEMPVVPHTPRFTAPRKRRLPGQQEWQRELQEMLQQAGKVMA